MKMLFAAIAMAIASPALAQAAPAASHADHAHHHGQGTPSGQSHADHAAATPSDPHAGHDMSGGNMECCEKTDDGTMACCAKMKAEGKAMPCCDKAKAEGEDTSPGADADPHAGHDMPSQ